MVILIRKVHAKIAFLALSVAFLSLFASEPCVAINYEHVYDFYVHGESGWEGHRLYVSLAPSLYDYYGGRIDDSGFAVFVTPDAFRNVAEDIWSVCAYKPRNEEEFANAVLMLVHQIPYYENPFRYAVVTLSNNMGDCDTLSYLAASIMKAGGLDVVLLYYEGMGHINVGVYLPYTPIYHDPNANVTYYEYAGKRYYVAECTSKKVNLCDDWKVGDCPNDFAGMKPKVISLENCEKTSPDRISSHLDSPLKASSIELTLSTPSLFFGESTTISGSISPKYSGKQITIYVSHTGFSWSVLETLTTDSEGKYSYIWSPLMRGSCNVRASWSGYGEYAGADSDTLYFRVSFSQIGAVNIASLSYLLITILVAGVVLICVSTYKTLIK
jgi:hypothetical protein